VFPENLPPALTETPEEPTPESMHLTSQRTRTLHCSYRYCNNTGDTTCQSNANGTIPLYQAGRTNSRGGIRTRSKDCSKH